MSLLADLSTSVDAAGNRAMLKMTTNAREIPVEPR
jgi:hypothetical protein